MKKTDFLVLLLCVAVFLPFFIFPALLQFYKSSNAAYPYLASFIKFAILATFGECLGLRLRTGKYNKPGFGLMPRALIWGFLGIVIKVAFVIFGEGSPVVLKTLGFDFPGGHPADILRQPGFSWLKLLSALSVGTLMNLLFAPVFMIFHRITDTHILNTGGTLTGFFTPLPVKKYIHDTDWTAFWDFVIKKTIPLFWIPAQTLNFMLPEGYRILVAAIYSVILGILLSIASIMQLRK
jgi:small-conductance mechanosensitive channel